MATVIVGIVVFGSFVGIIARGIINRKHGKSGCAACGCDCASCGGCGGNKPL